MNCLVSLSLCIYNTEWECLHPHYYCIRFCSSKIVACIMGPPYSSHFPHRHICTSVPHNSIASCRCDWCPLAPHGHFCICSQNKFGVNCPFKCCLQSPCTSLRHPSCLRSIHPSPCLSSTQQCEIVYVERYVADPEHIQHLSSMVRTYMRSVNSYSTVYSDRY